MKPGVKTITAGVVLFLVGAIAVPLLVILPLALMESKDTQFQAPGSVEVTVKEPGRYYLWNDFRTVYQGRSYDRSERIPDGIIFQIKDANGAPLHFSSDTSITSTSGGSSRKSIGYVRVETPGKLAIEVSGQTDDRVFSFSQSGLLKMFGLIFGGIGLSLLVAFAGVGLLIWGIVKLVRANKLAKT